MGEKESQVNKVATILRKAAATVQKGWCKHSEAEDSKGNEVEAIYPKAVKWCVAGAIYKNSKGCEESANDAFDCLTQVIKTSMITKWNDSDERKKREVVAALRKAAKLAEGK